MVLLLLASALAVLGLSWARTASATSVAALDQFSNAAGFLTKIVRVIDGLRELAMWLSPAFSNGAGRGPLASVREAASDKRVGGPPSFTRPPGAGVSVTDMSVFGGVPA